jgi:hypothetical protein
MWDHPDSTTAPLGKYSPKTLSAGTGRYCVLINGSTDAAFVISDVKWSTISAGGATMEDRNTSIAIEGSMRVSEPRGVIFMNQIVDCCRALGVDSSTAVFVLKTFFIGYVDKQDAKTSHPWDLLQEQTRLPQLLH